MRHEYYRFDESLRDRPEDPVHSSNSGGGGTPNDFIRWIGRLADALAR